MTIKELEEFMISKGVVIRAIPREVTEIYEVAHLNKFKSDPKYRVSVEYLKDYKREMLVVKSSPRLGGKFLVKTQKNTLSSTMFTSKCFDSIEQAVESLGGLGNG